MPALKSPPTPPDLHDAARQAHEAYVACVFDQVEGKPVTPADALAIATADGRSLKVMAMHVDTLSRRKALVEAYEARDWDAEHAKLLEDYRVAEKNVEIAKAAAEQARTACGEARQRSEAALAQRSRLYVDRDRAKNEFRQAMKATGDVDDWRSIPNL